MCKQTFKSTEERMLLKALSDINQIANKIFGTNCNIEVNISGAPVSKVAIIEECNKETFAGKDKVTITEGKNSITVYSSSFIPF